MKTKAFVFFFDQTSQPKRRLAGGRSYQLVV
jgi:hypothetical protein